MTAVVGKPKDAVLQDFGSDGNERVAMHEVMAGHPRPTVSVLNGAGGLVAIEINGFQGSREEVLRAASKDGKAASVVWNVNGQTRFTCARQGRILCDVDLLLDEDPDGLPASLKRLLPTERVDANLEAVGAAMIEAFTGVQFTQQTIAGLDDAFVLRPVLAPLEAETPDLTTLSFDHPELVEQLVAVGGTKCRQIAQWAAQQSVQHVGLHDDPRVQSITTQLVTDAPARETAGLIELVLQFERDAAQAVEADDARDPDEWDDMELAASTPTNKSWQRQWATTALRHNCITDPVSAALGAVYAATNCFGVDGREAAFVDDLARTFSL